jgi:hypothetical protein
MGSAGASHDHQGNGIGHHANADVQPIAGAISAYDHLFIRYDPLRPSWADPVIVNDDIWRVRWRRPGWRPGRYGTALFPTLDPAITRLLERRDRMVTSDGPMQSDLSFINTALDWHHCHGNITTGGVR